MTDNDFDLLQLAAKACGKHFDPTRRSLGNLWVVRDGATGQEDQVPWNPLHRPADLCELIFKLKINIDCDGCCAWRGLNGEIIQEWWRDDRWGVDGHATEAEAVLHVAAELGRRIK